MSQTMSQSNMSQKTAETLNPEDIYDDMPELEKINETTKYLMEEREKYNAKLKIWKTREEAQEADKKTCLQLQNMFHMAMLMGFLPNLNTRTSMMNYLNTRGNPDWDNTYIWSLADSNKIGWVQGYGDPQPYEEYKKNMNNRLAEILRPENVIC